MSSLPYSPTRAPRFAEADASRLAIELFGISGSARALPSERDRNFLVTDAAGARFVLKIANADEEEAVLDFQHRAIEHLAARAPSLALPRIVPALSGGEIGSVAAADGRRHVVRVLTYVPGLPLARARPHAPDLLRSLGRRLAEMDRAFNGFAHAAMRRPLHWDLRRAGEAATRLSSIDGESRRLLVERALTRFADVCLPVLATLRAQVIHHDWNDHNVLVAEAAGEGREVVGAVDFGDMIHGPLVFDLAVALAYAMLAKPDPIGAARLVVAGYHEVLPLTETELGLLDDLVRARLVMSVTFAAAQHALAPDNEYLCVSERDAWATLHLLDEISPDFARYAFRDACGLAACPSSRSLVDWVERHRSTFAPILGEPISPETTTTIDLGAGSLDLTDMTILGDVGRFSVHVGERMRGAGARVGLGRYGEARVVYSSDLFRREGNDGPEWRTVHLGLDLFTEAGVPVHAPLDGTVHSFADNAGALDYGPTIVLEHRVDGLRFYTLYGHLSRASLEGLASGQPVARGQRLGWIGAADENGGWPPHLHLQLVIDLLGRRGDFPGVGTPAERAIWTSVCPDPGALAGLGGQARAPSPSTGDILAARRLRIGPSLSASYRRPLTIVRGFMQHLWDADGRQYLDAVNNVPHVGHGHPRVVAAATRQMAVLNTNTRYLHEALVRYAGRLTALFPPELSVCYFVSSGSEANELALRLARAHTGRHGVVVLDGAYHGNTSSLVDISPYKCEGPGGRGLPPHVRKVPMPDVYRGRYRADDPRAAERYAAHAGEAFEALAADGQAAAAFFAESLMSCGGQIVLPDGYLAEVYRHARAAGVVTVADEVQVGLGRVGSHMWGFETQHVVPDIVTLGKPIGNGYPLGAVVTRREIADSFANGMEYFSTFGGSTAACAVGLAVLDVLEEEQLRQNAARVGAHLETGLRRLADQYPIVGDVRGLGLFLGVELVRDRDRRTPAGDQASYVANRLRDRGVLVSTDGPDHNVLKIKPPMVFTAADADRLVESLDVVLAEDAAQAAS